MGIERASLYMPHRDNPAVPVGEFVSALAELVDAGTIDGYGFSNWPLHRVRDAVDYAAARGLAAPSGVNRARR